MRTEDPDSTLYVAHLDGCAAFYLSPEGHRSPQPLPAQPRGVRTAYVTDRHGHLQHLAQKLG